MIGSFRKIDGDVTELFDELEADRAGEKFNLLFEGENCIGRLGDPDGRRRSSREELERE